MVQLVSQLLTRGYFWLSFARSSLGDDRGRTLIAPAEGAVRPLSTRATSYRNSDRLHPESACREVVERAVKTDGPVQVPRIVMAS